MVFASKMTVARVAITRRTSWERQSRFPVRAIAAAPAGGFVVAFALALVLAMSCPASAGAPSPGDAALREAAAAGDPQALFATAAAYETGAGVAHDLRLAAHYFKLAAARGHHGAQYRLGVLYLAGAGVERNPREAYRWLALAAQDEGEAAVLADALREAAAAEVPSEELAKVRAEVARFAPESGPVTTPEPAASIAALPDAPQLAAALAGQLRRTGCGEPRVAEIEDGGVQVSAFVPQALDRTLLDAAIQALANARPLALDLVEIEPSLCGVIELLDASRPRLEPLDGVVLRDAAGAAKATFADGERLIIEVPLQRADRYVWVDYFVHDGQVLHMVPSPETPDNKVAGDGRLVLGKGEEWVIGPPFGNDLVVVFATSRPLYEGSRPQLEPVAEYLRFLRARFAHVPPDDTIRVASRLVRTEEG